MSFKTRCKHALLMLGLTALYFLMTINHTSAMAKTLAIAEVREEAGVRAETIMKEPNNGKGKHLLLVLVPEFSFNELPLLLGYLDVSVIKDLRVGAMSMRTARGMNLVNNLFTLSTGQPALGLADWSAYHQEEEFYGEKAGEKYIRWAGRKSHAPIVHPAIFQLQNLWQKQGLSPDLIGWLGQTLQEQGIVTAAFGNSDTLEKKQRIAPTLVMNRFGESEGIVSEAILSADSYFPTGNKTDWARLSTELTSIWHKYPQSFITVELGDLVRLHAERERMQADYWEKVRQDWIMEWGRWLESLVQEVKSTDLPLEIWLLSPMVSAEAKREGKMLAPFLTWSQDQGNALLSSLTTKQAGIMANIDLLPTLFSYFGIETEGIRVPKPLVGQRIRPVKPISMSSFLVGQDRSEPMMSSNQPVMFSNRKEDIYSWLNHLEYLFLIYQARRDVITTYIIIVICLLLLTTGYWWWEWKKRGITEGLRLACGAILLTPLFYLWLTPLIVWLKPWQWIVILLLLSMMAGWFLRLFCRSDALYLAVLGLINTALILVDLWQGSPLLKRSFLGYDPIVGARFYGIGNEYAGFLLGSSLLAVIALTIWLTRRGVFQDFHGRRRKQIYAGAVLLLYTAVIYMLAAPQYGTNFGATIASCGAYLFLFISFFSSGWNWRWLAAGVAFVIPVLVLFFYGHLAGEHTHLGAALSQLMAGNWEVLLEIVQRKWQMNLRLIRVSLWGKLFVISLFVLALVLFRLKRKQELTHPDLWLSGFQVMVLGAILILLVNDSGIVAAATTMLYVTFPFLYLRLT